MEAPICLIENTANGKLVMNPKAIDILSGITQPAVVVSIVGMYRTGKSYLMNKLARAQTGFKLGSTVQAKTKGIWMWCVPHPSRKDHTLVLLDTEGLGDVEKEDSKNDVWIFTLALMLSSAMVYNSTGSISQDALEKLAFVRELSELIKVKSAHNDDEEAEFSRHFPIFIWAVRDFHLCLEIAGARVSADKYLENVLALKPKKTLKDTKYNELRESIQMYFGTRKCFVFDPPTIDNKFLQKLEEVADNDLNPNFVAQSREFCDYVWKNANTKTVSDTVTVTGRRLGELAKYYTEAVSSSGFVCMEDAVVSLAEKENKLAVQEATKHYEDMMKKVQLHTETLDDFMTRSSQYEDEARQIFFKRSFKDNDQQFLQEYLENLYRLKVEFSCMNEEKSREMCEGLIKKHSEDFEKALAMGAFLKPGGHGKFQKAINTMKEKYNKEEGKGVKAEDVFQEYMTAKQADELAIIKEDNILIQKQKEEQVKKLKKELKETKEKCQRMKEAQDMAFLKIFQEKMDDVRREMNEKLEQVNMQMKRELRLHMMLALQQEEQIEGLKEGNRGYVSRRGGPAHVSATGEHFVDKHRLALIERISLVEPIVEELRSLLLLTDEQYETIIHKATSQEQMRELYRHVTHWGNDDKDEVYQILEKHIKPVIKKLQSLP